MEIENIRKRRIIILVISILIFAFLWQLFLTWGFDFFWEDLDIFHLYWSDSTNYQIFKEKYSPNSGNASYFPILTGILKGYFKNSFSVDRLYQIKFSPHDFMARPYQFLTWDLLKVIFNKKVIFYRILKPIIFAINACIIFLICRRLSLWLAMLSVLLYMTSAETWLSATYINDLGLLAQCAVMLSVLLFIKLTEIHHLRLKNVLFYYFPIILASNFAVLSKGDGRYLAAIFFLTILFFRRKELRFHVIPLIFLFMIEFPLLGYVKKIFTHESFSPINLISHGSTTSSSTLSSLITAVNYYEFPKNALGIQLLLILFICIIFQFFIKIPDKNKISSDSLKTSKPILKERLFLFTLWFICTFLMCLRARSFRYGYPYELNKFSFQLYDLAFFIAPFIIALCYFIYLIINSDINVVLKKIFISACVFLMVSQIYSNIIRLDGFRENWKNYFFVWQNAKSYIEKEKKNALILAFTNLAYNPIAFYNSGNKILSTTSSCKESEFCDYNFLETRIKDGFEGIFVLGKNELQFRGSSAKVILQKKEEINSDSKVLYDRLKLISGHKSDALLYLYYFKIKNR
ncbi:MAG: hypothetical protein PHG69_06800 [Candidatus Omnitrophica bacterium]|nr:hypothetical protein [Candidatus Omnitrophota bacterium]